MKRRSPALVVAVVLGMAWLAVLAGGGCARRAGKPPATTAAAPRRLEPLRIARQDLSDAGGGKLLLQVVVAADATPVEVEDLIHRLARAERADDQELWISVYLEGMDLNSLAYALGIRRPGAPLVITHRESVQTYR